MELFLFFAVHGVVSGIIYLVATFIRGLTNNALIITIVLDFACGLVIGILFYRACILSSTPSFQLQLSIFYLLGFASTIISLKKFVASALNYVYNKVRKAIILLIEKNKRRKKDEHAKTTEKN